MRPGLSDAAAVAGLRLPDAGLLPAVAAAAGLERHGGLLYLPGTRPSLGRAEPGLRHLEEWLAQDPYNAPTRAQLQDWGLHQRELATAARLGRIVRLGPDIVLAPDALDQALRQLADLPQPFSTSQARQRWNTTRRVAIPLLEHLDAQGHTERVTPELRRLRG